MKYELTLYEVGKLLKGLTKEYKVDLLSKITLSGGWLTLTGEASVEEVPRGEGVTLGNNIISLKVKTGENEGAVLKITGAKNKKFNIDIAATKLRVISGGGVNINKLQTNNEECKLRIDEDMIFTINTTADNVSNLLEK